MDGPKLIGTNEHRWQISQQGRDVGYVSAAHSAHDLSQTSLLEWCRSRRCKLKRDSTYIVRIVFGQESQSIYP